MTNDDLHMLWLIAMRVPLHFLTYAEADRIRELGIEHGWHEPLRISTTTDVTIKVT